MTRARFAPQAAAAGAAACLVACLAGCSGPGPRHFAESAVDRRALASVQSASRADPEFNVDPLPARLPRKPWAGTVSHHLVAAPLIDAWYAALAARGRYRLFIVISPRHSSLGRQAVALSDRDWDAGNGIVRTDGPAVRALASRLGVPLEHAGFYGEHGIGTQVPFIRKHFPGSRILPILLEERHRNSADLARLSEALEPLLRSRKDVFLLLSTDFTHHADSAKLALCDERTLAYFRAVSTASAPLAGCDSRAGILVMSMLADRLGRQRALVQSHADSGRILGVTEDMTSYFFTFLY